MAATAVSSAACQRTKQWRHDGDEGAGESETRAVMVAVWKSRRLDRGAGKFRVPDCPGKGAKEGVQGKVSVMEPYCLFFSR